MKALAEFIGACGLQNASDLRPEIFFKRTEQNLNQSFAELYFSKHDQPALNNTNVLSEEPALVKSVGRIYRLYDRSLAFNTLLE